MKMSIPKRALKRGRLTLIAGVSAALLTATAQPALATTDRCVYTQASLTLTVSVPSSGLLNVSRSGDTLSISFQDPADVCGSGTYAVGTGYELVRTLSIEGSAGDERVSFAEATVANWGANSPSYLERVVNLGDDVFDGDIVYLNGSSSGDTITASTFATYIGVDGFTISGGQGNDTLIGSSLNDLIFGGEGSDTLKGGDGQDTIEGGAGTDSIQGNSGTDCADYSHETTTGISVNLATGVVVSTDGGSDNLGSIECIAGSEFADTMDGSIYTDYFLGFGGNDTLRGRGNQDVLDGGSGVDTATYAEQTYAVTVNLTVGSSSGAAGSDVLYGIENVTGGSAGDTLIGNSSGNVLLGGAGADTLTGMAGDDTLTGGTGLDTVAYAYAGAASAGIAVDLTDTGAQDIYGDGGDEVDTITEIENLIGSPYGDDLTGTSAVNIINGGAGNDTVNAGGGNDTVNGGDDPDTLNGEAGNDTLRGGGSGDTVFGGLGADPIWGDAGDDLLCGGDNGDTLRGGDGDDILVGGSGGSGVDVMYGDGNTAVGDTISYDSGDCSDAVLGTTGVKLRLSATGVQQATTGAGTDVVGGGVENLTGSSYADILVGDVYDNVIDGLGGDDTMQGGGGDDVIYSGGGSLNKADGQLGTDECYVSDSGAWAPGNPYCETVDP